MLRRHFSSRSTLDVRVITDEDLVIDNNVAKAQLGADLRVINVASMPALSGRAELREGGRLYLGRNTYIVETGTIDFADPSMIEPCLGSRPPREWLASRSRFELPGPATT